MKFSVLAAVLNLAAVQAAAIPAEAVEAAGPSDGVQINAPRLITPKYRTTAKRAIIRYPAFELKAKGVSGWSSCRIGDAC
jgi:hypothetical protein